MNIRILLAPTPHLRLQESRVSVSGEFFLSVWVKAPCEGIRGGSHLRCPRSPSVNTATAAFTLSVGALCHRSPLRRPPGSQSSALQGSLLGVNRGRMLREGGVPQRGSLCHLTGQPLRSHSASSPGLVPGLQQGQEPGQAPLARTPSILGLCCRVRRATRHPPSAFS